MMPIGRRQIGGLGGRASAAWSVGAAPRSTTPRAWAMAALVAPFPEVSCSAGAILPTPLLLPSRRLPLMVAADRDAAGARGDRPGLAGAAGLRQRHCPPAAQRLVEGDEVGGHRPLAARQRVLL